MSGYQVLARRFRPQRFEDLVGQETVVRTLRNTIAANQIGHAYLFSGLRGVGKTTVARLLAKALNCEQGPTPTPCGVCVPCQEITQGSSLDVLEIDAASTRGIDEIRELREVARLAPARDRYRVFILDEAHQLTKDAFPALLKILEEPPAHVVFVLASTEKEKFPPTILSRCQQIDFRPIPVDRIAAHLLAVAQAENFALSDGAAQQLARAAAGSVRDALSLLDRVRAFSGSGVDEVAVAEVLGLPAAEVLLELWQHVQAGEVDAVLATVRREFERGHDPLALYQQLVQLLDTLLLLASDGNAPIPFAEAYRAPLAESAARAGTPLLLRLLALALDQRGLIAVADDPALAVTVAVGRLSLWPRLRRVEALLVGGGGERQLPAAPGGGEPPATLGQSDASAPAGSLAARLEEELHRAGQPILASRVRMAHRAALEGTALVLQFTGVPRATVQSLKDAVSQLEAAVRQGGLAETVRIELADNAPDASGPRERVAADERVRRVLQVFGGTIENVEENP